MDRFILKFLRLIVLKSQFKSGLILPSSFSVKKGMCYLRHMKAPEKKPNCIRNATSLFKRVSFIKTQRSVWLTVGGTNANRKESN